MTRALPWTTEEYRLVIDPQPRDPGNGKSPNRPRPPKPVQPRDDGQSRTVYDDSERFYSTGAGSSGGTKPPPRPWPRDPGNGKGKVCARGPHPRDDGSNGVFSSNGKPNKPQPRDPGGKTKRTIGPTPRDAGF